MSYTVDLGSMHLRVGRSGLGTVAVTGPRQPVTTVTPVPPPAPAPPRFLPPVSTPPVRRLPARELEGPARGRQRQVIARPAPAPAPRNRELLPSPGSNEPYPGAYPAAGPTFNITIEGGGGGQASGAGGQGSGAGSPGGGAQYELPPTAELVVEPTVNGPGFRLSPLTVGLGAAAAFAAFYLLKRS